MRRAGGAPSRRQQAAAQQAEDRRRDEEDEEPHRARNLRCPAPTSRSTSCPRASTRWVAARATRTPTRSTPTPRRTTARSRSGEEDDREEVLAEPIATAAIDLASGARYRATGKRKTAIARVTLRPGSGSYLVNGRTLEEHFPRLTLQRNIRQPLETVGYQDRMDVVARLHGGGISAQAGALRHGVSRALLEADPNLRGELKRRGFLTRDSRAKERKKAGLKKARKRPQFSKR